MSFQEKLKRATDIFDGVYLKSDRNCKMIDHLTLTVEDEMFRAKRNMLKKTMSVLWYDGNDWKIVN